MFALSTHSVNKMFCLQNRPTNSILYRIIFFNISLLLCLLENHISDIIVSLEAEIALALQNDVFDLKSRSKFKIFMLLYSFYPGVQFFYILYTISTKPYVSCLLCRKPTGFPRFIEHRCQDYSKIIRIVHMKRNQIFIQKCLLGVFDYSYFNASDPISFYL